MYWGPCGIDGRCTLRRSLWDWQSLWLLHYMYVSNSDYFIDTVHASYKCVSNLIQTITLLWVLLTIGTPLFSFPQYSIPGAYKYSQLSRCWFFVSTNYIISLSSTWICSVIWHESKIKIRREYIVYSYNLGQAFQRNRQTTTINMNIVLFNVLYY